MQLWCRTVHAGGVACEHSHHQQHACRKHHGPHPHVEHPSLWSLQQHGQPRGDCCNSRQTRGHDTHAVCTRDTRSVDTWVTHSIARQHAQPTRQFQADVHVGRSDPGDSTGTIHGNDSLNLTCLNTFSP